MIDRQRNALEVIWNVFDWVQWEKVELHTMVKVSKTVIEQTSLWADDVMDLSILAANYRS